MRPDYGKDYSVYRALISNRYIRRYYRREVSEVPVLGALDQALIDSLVINEIAKVRFVRVFAPILLLLFLAFAFVHLVPPRLEDIATPTAMILIIGMEILGFRIDDRLHREHRAADKLFFTISMLARNEACWRDSKFRRELASDVERVARQVERISLSLSGIAPSVRRECLSLSRVKAQALRELEMLIIRPSNSSYEGLLKQLIDDLVMLTEGRWYDLPEKKYVPQTSRLMRIFQIGGAVIAFGGAVVLIAFVSKLGSAASLAATALVAVAVALLNFAGIPLARIERYAQTGSDVVTPRK